MHASSIFNIKIDFKKSKGSFIYDKNRKKYYLDFFGQYSTLAIGYNHKIFKSKKYLKIIKNISHQKITNCEILSDESINFQKNFKKQLSNKHYSNFHFCCTGALAIEAAIKTAIEHSKKKNHRIITFKNSFHGINGYGGIFTDRFSPVSDRLRGFPGSYYKPVDGPSFKDLTYNKNNNKKKILSSIIEIEEILKKKDTAAILIEPIMSTVGDYYYPKEFFKKISILCKKNNIPLIFDEIQTGFFTTGRKWYYEHLGIIPDILVFGKKTQLSGIMVKKKFSKIFQNPIKLEVTWDADVIDMIRCNFILKEVNKTKVIKKINIYSKKISNFLKTINIIKNVRSCGYLIAFDLNTKKNRDRFFLELFKNGMLCNKTRDVTIRFRPNLMLTQNELELSKKIILKCINKISKK